MVYRKILISGPIFNTPSGPSGQGGKLYTLLKKAGYNVYKKSAFRNKLLRFADTLSFIILRPFSYDIVLLQMFLLRAFVMEDIIIKICRLFDKKSIVVIRGGAFVEFYTQNTNWCKRVLARVDVITTPSIFIANFLHKEGFKARVIPNFIDLNLFPYRWQNPIEKKILWVRAFHDIYKPELAIKAIAELKKKHPEIILTMVGPDQGKLAICKSLIEELDLMDNVTIEGVVPNHQLNDFYASHQVFITTTSYESFGVALIEAAASGIPMVSTDVGEIPYIWKNNENMLIVRDNNVIEFAEAINKLLENPDLRLNLSKNARLVSENYTWEKVKDNWHELLK